MKYITKLKDTLKIKFLAIFALCILLAISVTAVVLADEITIAANDRSLTDPAEETLNIESEESRKKEFTDPHYQVSDAESIETGNIGNETAPNSEQPEIETVQEPNQADIETVQGADQSESEIALGDQIVEFAYSFVGWLPYVWGGESLEYGADCCGFTQAVYSAFGIDIPRTVEEQAFIGCSVSLEDAQPGDIVIYYGHVGLYAGEGMLIHSPHPGACVSYETVYIQDILDIRRIL